MHLAETAWNFRWSDLKNEKKGESLDFQMNLLILLSSAIISARFMIPLVDIMTWNIVKKVSM